MAGQLPVFAYGVLRPGFADFSMLLSDDVREAVWPGALLLDYQAFPFAVATGSPDDRVGGVLVTVPEDRYEKVLAEVDEVFGYRPGDPGRRYDREAVTVLADGQPVRAWVYVSSAWLAPRLRLMLPVVAGGDWQRQVSGAARFGTGRVPLRPAARSWAWPDSASQSAFTLAPKPDHHRRRRARSPLWWTERPWC